MTTAQDVLKEAIRQIGVELAPLGFRQRGSRFFRSLDEVANIIEFQSSRSSTGSHALVAINYGVVLHDLFEGKSINSVKAADAHWQGRATGTDGLDAWWSVRAADDPPAIAQMLSAAVKGQVLPRFETLDSNDAFRRLWVSGESTTLSHGKRLLLLGRLLHQLGRRNEFSRIVDDLVQHGATALERQVLEELQGLEWD